MKPVLIVLRINGGQAYATFRVYAETEEAALVTAKVHLVSMTGLDVE